MDKALDGVSAEVDGWRMEKVLVNVCEHAGGGLKGMVGCLETGLLGSGLVGRMAGEDGRDVEYYGRLFEGKRVLGCDLVGESIEPVGLLVSRVST